MHTLSLKQISSTENYQPNSSYLLAWPPEETTVNGSNKMPNNFHVVDS